MPELQSLIALKKMLEQSNPLAGTTKDAAGIEEGLTSALDGLPGYQSKSFPGMDAFEPSEAELRVLQSQPDTGGMSRDMLRDFLMGKTQRGLEQDKIQHGQKLELATEPQRIAGQYDVEQQQVANQGGLEQAQMTGQYGVRREQAAGDAALRKQQAEDTARSGNIDKFGALARQLGGNRSVSMSGIGSIGSEPSAGSQSTLIRDITAARGAKARAAAAGNSNALAQADAALQAAVAGYVANSGFSDGAKNIADEVMKNPTLLDLGDVDQILDALDYDLEVLPPEIRNEAAQLFAVLRGKM